MGVFIGLFNTLLHRLLEYNSQWCHLRGNEEDGRRDVLGEAYNPRAEKRLLYQGGAIQCFLPLPVGGIWVAIPQEVGRGGGAKVCISDDFEGVFTNPTTKF